MTESLDITLPQDWTQLTDRQLRQYIRGLDDNTLDPFALRLCLAIRWAGLKPTKDTHVFKAPDKRLIGFTDIELAGLAQAVEFLDAPPQYPVRPERMGGAKARPAMLHDLTFGEYLTAENAFNGYAHTSAQKYLNFLDGILYPSRIFRFFRIFRKARHSVASVLWWAGYRAWLARKYPWFMPSKPTDDRAAVFGAAPGSPEQYMKAMRAQVRALTKGDITKEQQVMEMPAESAIAELDALVEESETLKAQSKAH